MTTAAHGLFKLPAELRNEIYGLVFTSEYRDADAVNLLTATPPPKNLLLTCKAIHSEAGKLYKTCYQSFWSETHFVLFQRSGYSIQKAQMKSLGALDAIGLDHIRDLRVLWHGDTDSFHQLLDFRGGWVLTERRFPRLFYRYKPGGPPSQPMRLRWDIIISEDQLRDECENHGSEVTMYAQLCDQLCY
ncbi:hypothetical protein CLAFUW4_04989 [Fulvia fulva]|uniref:Uncharacterized protein n=1 Tax=Passalora fulva TaxID=5499 RepID=A0A9Q8UUC9_PASFU|nr:uncharacterized protein CLAFUR5_11918 [Fulvia fulva]KAK4626505.1 hypothetical protein CLAFUR4_04975 [Fulvia fulva]KAK4628546.1 hypothetical protein CLAFUR0_04979 [Fulvia fulva]UJO22765.1 hypothetical protein CLAFUR5_11918 [Fulvia fulva]WPV13564.1 hypothetical protein CLAFUW4_04989 [Fulvia fulva]WPV28055.1 hypothetical protein CLAFUW7_04983 [Fulvia fulva]